MCDDQNKELALKGELSISIAINSFKGDEVIDVLEGKKFADIDISSIEAQDWWVLVYSDSGDGYTKEQHKKNEQRIKSEEGGLFDIMECVRWHKGGSMVNPAINSKSDGYAAIIIWPKVQ